MFTINEIIEATNGRAVNISDMQELKVLGVSKDTRTINPNELYVAIVGENFDGHDFISMAVDKGASLVLASDESKIPQNVSAVIVNDTVKSLGDLARFYRRKCDFKVIAVTGSVGKTSTREMIASVLSGEMKVVSTPSNQNNDIGMPMTILSASKDTEVLVLEMGMRLLGEIEYLTKIAEPDIALITIIGTSHIERLKSRENIMKAKLEILKGLKEDGVFILNGDDDMLLNYFKEHKIGNKMMIVTVDDGKNDLNQTLDCISKSENCLSMINAVDVTVNDKGTSYKLKDLDECVKLNVSGIHHVRNSLFSIACANCLGIDFSTVKKTLSSYEKFKGRGNVIKTRKYTIIDDAYNASLESMSAAFKNLDMMVSDNRKVLVLGCILEMGDYAKQIHYNVGKEIAKYKFDKVFIVGNNKEDIRNGIIDSSNFYNNAIVLCENNDSLKESVLEYISKGDIILFKGSNLFGLQKMAEYFSQIGDNDQ